MLNDGSRGYLKNCCYAKQLSMALLHVSHPPVQTCRAEDISYFYFLDILSSEPHYKSFFGGPLAVSSYSCT